MSTTYIPAALRRQIVEDFANHCAYCHSPEILFDGIYEVDHIVPEAAGGSTTRDNLCLTCRLCNDYKGAKLFASDPQTNRRILLFHPRLQHWKRHFEWSADGKMILGKTKCGRATVAALRLNNSSLVRMRGLWQELGAFPPDWIRQRLQDRAIP